MLINPDCPQEKQSFELMIDDRLMIAMIVLIEMIMTASQFEYVVNAFNFLKVRGLEKIVHFLLQGLQFLKLTGIVPIFLLEIL